MHARAALALTLGSTIIAQEGGEQMCVEWSTVWSAAGAIATAVGATAIIFASNQLRFDAWLKAHEIWNTQDFLDKRSRVYSRKGVGG